MHASMVAAKNVLRCSDFSKFKTGIMHYKIFLFGPVGDSFCANTLSFEFSKFSLVTNFTMICQ